ncbi:MAG: hypothetical protein OWQ50_02605 [Acidianus infernus]|nr:hypothetical protein [Acidianus infernus]
MNTLKGNPLEGSRLIYLDTNALITVFHLCGIPSLSISRAILNSTKVTKEMEGDKRGKL